jgi:hypothetical protein
MVLWWRTSLKILAVEVDFILRESEVESLDCVLKNKLRDLRGGRYYMSTLFVLYMPYFGLLCLLSRHDNVLLLVCIGFSSPFELEADIILQF